MQRPAGIIVVVSSHPPWMRDGSTPVRRLAQTVAPAAARPRRHRAAGLRAAAAPITAQLLLNRGLTAPDDAPPLPRRPPHRPARTGIAAGRPRGGQAHLRGGAPGPAHLRLRRLRRGRRHRRRHPSAMPATAGRRQVDLYVPHRLEEGYGLNCERCGRSPRPAARWSSPSIAASPALRRRKRRKRLGLELDRHRPPRIQGDAARRRGAGASASAGNGVPFGGLCGSAVAIKLAWALAQTPAAVEKVTPRFREFLLDARGAGRRWAWWPTWCRCRTRTASWSATA